MQQIFFNYNLFLLYFALFLFTYFLFFVYFLFYYLFYLFFVFDERKINFESNKTLIFVICANVYYPKSFYNIKDWKNEVNYTDNTKYFLVGTKSDLRDNKEYLERLEEQRRSIVSHDQALLFAKEIDCSYLVTSSIYGENVENIFERIVDLHLEEEKPKKKKKDCILN